MSFALGENGWMEEHLEMAMYDPLGGECWRSTSIHALAAAWGRAGATDDATANLHFELCDPLPRLPQGLNLPCLTGAASGQIATAKLGLELASSHAAALGQEPRFTTAHDKSVCTVDYIWFTPRGVPDPESRGKRVTTADVSAILLAPSKAVLGKGSVGPSIRPAARWLFTSFACPGLAPQQSNPICLDA